jgi:hypothetical protein
MRAIRAALTALALVAVPPAVAGAATLRIFSYDPANADTRHTAGGLTFEFNQGLTSTTVLRVLATEGDASAEVRRANPRSLAGGFSAAAGGEASAHDIYEVQPTDEGAALISAFCPGAKRAWMAFSKIRFNRDLRVLVIGDNGPAGAAHLCRTLDFSFHGEWRPPPGAPFDTKVLVQPGLLSPMN